MGPVDTGDATTQGELLDAARDGDAAAFDSLVGGHIQELYAHCYRMLGSVHDAEDALQEALLGAWRGFAGFEGRSSLRTWLYRICTNSCLRLSARRPRRILSPDYGPAFRQTADLGEPVTGPVWLEPLPDEALLASGQGGDPAEAYLHRECVELAFVAALQHLPGTQRAVLILRDVLQLSAAETADILDTTVASVNSALQRARISAEERVPRTSQQVELDALGDDGRRELVSAFVHAWEHADVEALLALLAEDARFTMPPLPAWFDGRRDIGSFLTERLFATDWRLVPIQANAQLAFACYQEQQEPAPYRLGAINVLTLRDGRVVEISAFLDPDLRGPFKLPEVLASTVVG